MTLPWIAIRPHYGKSSHLFPLSDCPISENSVSDWDGEWSDGNRERGMKNLPNRRTLISLRLLVFSIFSLRSCSSIVSLIFRANASCSNRACLSCGVSPADGFKTRLRGSESALVRVRTAEAPVIGYELYDDGVCEEGPITKERQKELS